ncbi:gamma-glutamyltransferase family protein [Allokutzneria sp. A3M-2-11 16]|uniref:gamma-glutamyltransferase n=1 Tax=Allokutzneria sp. A3M-2-11 16 TaxID=2962043 RepID=UPI0020B7A04A|nr:gamma-glutamyltransferase [Allokutzneria sp. A3M-2-11 16]MCP3802015.1 gamma-glutamyltransferase family protein [Allokutzneria sp. A3M-2-11 16]
MSLLDPATWDADERRAALDLGKAGFDHCSASGTARNGMVIGSTGPFAHLAGQRALEAGGSAVDAALTTAFAQIVLAAGSWVSFAGFFGMIHFDGATGEVTALSAGYGTFAEETDPASIPASPTPSGRTALVPGFVAGAHAAHQRFGKLDWTELWAPARYIAEHGVPVGETLAGMFAYAAKVLTRTPEGRAMFAPSGALPGAGDTFAPPALAATLAKLAEHGPDWMYRGPWAERFVDIVRRDGGRARMSDLSSYQPIWSRPASGRFAGHDLHTLPAPDTGGRRLLTALGLIDVADLGDPTTDPDALYWLIQIIRYVSGDQADLPSTESYDARWARLLRAGKIGTEPPTTTGGHSDCVVTADRDGNLTAVCHSINTAAWGSTGLVVDGIPLPDSASFQQAELAPGAHLPMVACPAIALSDSGAVQASSSIGSGLNAVTIPGIHITLRLGLDPAAAVALPLGTVRRRLSATRSPRR